MNVSIFPKIPKIPLVFPFLVLGLLAGGSNVGWGLNETTLNNERNIDCPYCSAASQTLRQEIQSMDAVAIGKLISDGRAEIDGNAEFRIERVLRGDGVIKSNEMIGANYFGPGKSAKNFLLLGVDPRALLWSSPLPLSEDGEKYVQAIVKLPDDSVKRLEFYQDYFEHRDSLLSRDAYDEFASAPYSDMEKIKDKMNRKQLLAWVQDPSKSPDRKRLYFTMLAICGMPEDADLFESMLTSDDPERRAGLDALISAYLTLRGEKGLPLIEERFLRNKKSQYTDIYSSVMALRFHATELEVLSKDSVVSSMHCLLERPDLADLVIPDLSRLGDWSQIDRLTELFKTATDDNSWVRVPVVNYLRACPLPEAKERIKELELIDPKAVQRASTFFPVPVPATPKKNTSSRWSPDPVPAQDRIRNSAWNGLAVRVQMQPNMRLADAQVLKGLDTPVDIASFSGAAVFSGAAADGPLWDAAPLEIASQSNLWAPMFVTLLGAVTLFLAMWMVAVSAGRVRWFVPAMAIARRAQ